MLGLAGLRDRRSDSSGELPGALGLSDLVGAFARVGQVQGDHLHVADEVLDHLGQVESSFLNPQQPVPGRVFQLADAIPFEVVAP
jgi:hypothetical protein